MQRKRVIIVRCTNLVKRPTEVGIYKRKQESKKKRTRPRKKRKQELDQESDQEKKKDFSFFLGRVLVFFLVTLFS